MRWLLAGLLGLGACTADEHPAPILGTTYRIGEERRQPDSELLIDILTTDAQCRKIANTAEEVALCRPFVDRANAEVQISFQFLDRTQLQPFPVALTDDDRDSLLISHDNSKQETWKLIPHNPRDSGQLYIVLIDGSGSMYETDENGRYRMQKVQRALKLDSVKNAFFPSPDAKTGVMLLMFTDKLTSIDGGAPRIIRRKGAYERMIDEHLSTRRGGYTYLYKAVRQSMTEVMKLPEVRKFLATRSAQPTIIALTDGFNNESASDTCGSNVGRLKQTLDVIRESRAKKNSGKPKLFTVGLGEKYRRQEKPEGINARVTKRSLCGQYGDSPIDGGLELQGIDHVSLAWLAEAGGGVSFVKQKPQGLAEVFLAAAAKRYDWFELKYRVSDSLFHRKSFETEIRVQRGYISSTKIDFFPSPWLDAPTADLKPGEEWSTRASLLKALTVLMPLLGIIVFLNYIPAAVFNARRRVFRRGRNRRK